MRLLITTIRWIIRAGVLSCILFAAGFVVFASMISPDHAPDGKNADGIVALTGGKARIGEAVKLLSVGRGKRMLITGVNPKTTSEQLELLLPQGRELFKCCIDLGRQAEDTTGNAIETRDWVNLHQFKSLIVVTSSYHMPRTLVELARFIPDAEIVPHAVVPRSFQTSDWWSDRDVLRLLFSEYVKFLPALARLLASQAGIDIQTASVISGFRPF